MSVSDIDGLYAELEPGIIGACSQSFPNHSLICFQASYAVTALDEGHAMMRITEPVRTHYKTSREGRKMYHMQLGTLFRRLDHRDSRCHHPVKVTSWV